MSDTVRVLTEPLGGSALVRRAMAHELPEWYAPRPADAAEWAARCRSTRRSAHDGWLERLRPAFGATLASSAAGARLERSAAAANGVVVTTGQQPGLFGGPVYTWAKALSALALADAIEQATHAPVAPVFWAATDDADFEEASTTAVAVVGGAEEIRIARMGPDGLPMARMPLGADVPAAFAALARGAGSAAFGEILDLARAAYAPGETVGGAYLRLLRAVLEPLGIAVIDASHPAARAASDPVLREALRHAAAVDRHLDERVREIESRGFAPQVPRVPGLSLVFVDEADGKRRVRLEEAGDLADRADAGTLGPNVLLRPVAERAILPTVAYVGGAGEVAYFAQVTAVAAALDRDVPLVVPRWSSTLVEPHVSRILSRLGLEIADLADPYAAETRLARSGLPAPVSSALADFRAAIAARSAALREAQDGASAPVLPASVIDGAEQALLHRLARLERRATAAQKRASDALMRDVATARGALFPLGVRQERALNLLPMVARYGPTLLDGMRAGAAAHASTLLGSQGRPAAGVPEDRGGIATG